MFCRSSKKFAVMSCRRRQEGAGRERKRQRERESRKKKSLGSLTYVTWSSLEYAAYRNADRRVQDANRTSYFHRIEYGNKTRPPPPMTAWGSQEARQENRSKNNRTRNARRLDRRVQATCHLSLATTKAGEQNKKTTAKPHTTRIASAIHRHRRGDTRGTGRDSL